MHPQSPPTDTRSLLKLALQERRNVLLEGVHGIGKSTLIKELAAELGLTLAYFNAATLDVFAHLIGIPTPLGPEHDKHIKFLRPRLVNEAQLVCFDDLNRAPVRVLNAVFELIQFHSLNGEPLSQLQSVAGVINPAAGPYQVTELDPALVDRFHVYLRLDPKPDRAWFVERLGRNIGGALVDWYNTDLDAAQRSQLSPRRLEYLGENHKKGIPLSFTFRPDATFPLALLEARFREDDSVLKSGDFAAEPERFQTLVAQDLDIAVRFAQLLPHMTPREKSQVKWLVTALPAEVLAGLQTSAPFVFRHVHQAVAKFESAADADAYLELLNERLPTSLVLPAVNGSARKPGRGK